VVIEELRILIVLVNYNGHLDTIECLESLLSIDYNNYSIIVSDNSKEDTSLNQLEAWARGNNFFVPNLAAPLKVPIAPKPVDYIKIEEETIVDNHLPKLILLKCKENKGFAAANNSAINVLKAHHSSFDWVWILNNDTVVSPDCLKAFHQHCETAQDLKQGIIGNNIYYYHKPTILQGIGGMYNRWLSTSYHLTEVGDSCATTQILFKEKVNYVMGASMFVSLNYIREVGLMDETYFLYFEEIDWATRGKKFQYVLGYACNCNIYHKHGASIGSGENSVAKSYISDFYGTRNKIIFTRKFYPFLLPTVYLSLVISIMLRIYKAQFSRAWMVMKLMFKS
jgi:GT2 family glycosyltransferase